jgi:hypothetical protein
VDAWDKRVNTWNARDDAWNARDDPWDKGVDGWMATTHAWSPRDDAWDTSFMHGTKVPTRGTERDPLNTGLRTLIEETVSIGFSLRSP